MKDAFLILFNPTFHSVHLFVSYYFRTETWRGVFETIVREDKHLHLDLQMSLAWFDYEQ